ncbi:hypothetical protein D3C86_1964160 [compost metagenome]
MRQAAREQLAVEPLDRSVDPGFRPSGAHGRAGLDDGVEGGVDADLECFGPNRAGQPARDVHAVQRQHAPAFRVDQEDALVLAGVRHGKNAALVAGDEIIDREGVVHGGPRR